VAAAVDFLSSTHQRRHVPEYHCHACGERFSADVENEYGTYEFGRCPNCESAKTTLAE
jgi:DNA-directed RNA polymerase subunit RPC12/RpoP